MPRLVKGGKYVFGWTTIRENGNVLIPDEAFAEYHFKASDPVIIMSGSKTSGGFSVLTTGALEASEIGQRIFETLGYSKESGSFFTTGLDVKRTGPRYICWTEIDHGHCIRLSTRFMEAIGINTANKLLVAMGSGLGPAFISRGPIYEEALKHPYLQVF